MKTIYCVISLLFFSSAVQAGEVYSQVKLRNLATAFIDSYEGHVQNSTEIISSEMLVLAGEFKGYVGAYLDSEQRGIDLQDSFIAACLRSNTFEEVALNASYLLVEMEPMPSLGAIENVGLAVRAFCSGRMPLEQALSLN